MHNVLTGVKVQGFEPLTSTFVVQFCDVHMFCGHTASGENPFDSSMCDWSPPKVHVEGLWGSLSCLFTLWGFCFNASVTGQLISFHYCCDTHTAPSAEAMLHASTSVEMQSLWQWMYIVNTRGLLLVSHVIFLHMKVIKLLRNWTKQCRQTEWWSNSAFKIITIYFIYTQLCKVQGNQDSVALNTASKLTTVSV